MCKIMKFNATKVNGFTVYVRTVLQTANIALTRMNLLVDLQASPRTGPSNLT